VALAPILVVWFDTGLLSKVVMAAIISFFPVLVNTVQGLNSVEPEALDLMTIFAASKWQVLTKLQFPQALPYLFTGLKVSATFAVVGAVVAEFVGSSAGIGYIVKSSSYYLNTELTFAAIVVAAMIGFLFFLMVGLLESMVVFWRPKGEQEFSGLTGDAAPDKV
jgi:NitT/TauT family transport system permease protein